MFMVTLIHRMFHVAFTIKKSPNRRQIICFELKIANPSKMKKTNNNLFMVLRTKEIIIINVILGVVLTRSAAHDHLLT